MTLVLIYGAPGTGKLTIASELSKQTNFSLFHNHMILNALSEIFGYDNPIRRKLEKEFRLRTIEEAVKASMDIIVTGVIMRDNVDFYRKIIKIVLDNKGECLLVHLVANKEALEKRIGEDSRRKLKKISTTEKLEEWLQKYPESFEKIDYPNQFSIDTSSLSPVEVVENIIQHYKLA